MKNRLLVGLALAFAAFPLASVAADAAAPAATAPLDWWTLVETYLLTPAAISGLCGFLAAVLPRGAPGTAWGIARMAIDFVAANWGNAKNEAKS